MNRIISLRNHSTYGVFTIIACIVTAKKVSKEGLDKQTVAAFFTFIGGLYAARTLKTIEYADGVSQCLRAAKTCGAVITETLLLVDVSLQKMFLLKSRKCVQTYAVSTAKNGTGQVENTGKTPLGLHTICEKIGEGFHENTYFESRKPVATLLDLDQEKAYITGRILRLKGLEEGYNLGRNQKGEVVDSFERYIYIHGTNKINELGKALSGGCVRIDTRKVIELFKLVKEKDLVFIFSTTK